MSAPRIVRARRKLQAQQRAYQRRGYLAIDPVAFESTHPCDDGAIENDELPDYNATLVNIRGPLEQYRSAEWDSYESIAERVELACTRPAANIVLCMSSPGGDAAGCFELARYLHQLCQASGKTLLAYVEERACSAAYAIATAAERIYLSDSGIVGSVGVLATRRDFSKQLAAQGVSVSFITSGARKADGHPEQPMGEAELAASQRIVDSMADVFYGLVAELRGVDAKPLDTGVFHGTDAVGAGLADEVVALSSLLLALKTGTNTMTPMETARKALQTASEGDGPDAASAKRALAAMDDGDKPAAGDEPDKPDAADDTDKPDAADDSDKPSDDDKDKDKEAARAYTMAARAQRELHAFKAEVAAEKDAAERKRLLESRPDFSESYIKTLAKVPMEVLRELVESTPRIATDATATAALGAASAAGTQGDRTGSHNRLPPEEAAWLDRRMGLTATHRGVVSTEHKMTLGASVPAPVKGA